MIFKTQSTHKILTTLSQTSLIHIKNEYNEKTFNETFIIHTTTSPNYPIITSIKTTTTILHNNPNKQLINHSIKQTLHFHKKIQRLQKKSNN